MDKKRVHQLKNNFYHSVTGKFVSSIDTLWHDCCKQATGCIAISTGKKADVDTKHQKHDLAHLESERLQAILDTARDGIIVIRTDGIIETVNQAVERIFGYQVDELVGRNVSMLMPSPYQQQHDSYLQRYLETEIKRIIGTGREVVGQRRDGSQFPLELAVGECGQGMERRFTGFVRDISEKRQIEQQLKSLSHLLENVREAIVVCDQEDRISYWNKGAEQLYGWNTAEALGQNCFQFKCRLADDEIQLVRQSLQIRGEWRGELRQKTKDGRAITVESYWSVLRDQQHSQNKLIINIDVTERKKLEAQFLRAQRLESIGVLAGGIAHDLNNVLTPILMSIKLLHKDRSPEQRKDLLDTAQTSVERGIDMVRQLVAFAGGNEGVHQKLKLNLIIQEVIKLLEHSIAKTIRIEEMFEPNLWAIKGDKTQLTQVLMNLCVNARDAMPEGGVLSIQATNTLLKHDAPSIHPLAKPGPYVLLTVTDTGMGIAPEVIDKIFDPFFTTKEFGKGTGLGLSTAMGILKSHGGFINVYSEVGNGTRVFIYLPASEGIVPASTQQQVELSHRCHGETILVVDDEPLILHTTRACLESHGYQVLTAAGGAPAVELYQHHPEIQLVLLDMMMPGMDGPAVLQRLVEINPQVNVIACSGLRGTERLHTVRAAGVKEFLQKPYSEESLLKSITNTLSLSRSPL